MKGQDVLGKLGSNKKRKVNGTCTSCSKMTCRTARKLDKILYMLLWDLGFCLFGGAKEVKGLQKFSKRCHYVREIRSGVSHN